VSLRQLSLFLLLPRRLTSRPYGIPCSTNWWVPGCLRARLLAKRQSTDEVSRETNELGAPAYEATVFIGWDKPSGRYVCLWLDVTGGGGLANDVFGYAMPADNKLAFVFGDDNGRILNTFAYDPDHDSWTWAIDNESDGMASAFARVTLVRQ